MRKILVVAMILVLSVMSIGCTSNELKLYNAFLKGQEMKSMEADIHAEFTLEGEGFGEDLEPLVNEAIKYVNNSSINIYQKSITNEDKTVAKGKLDTEFNFGGIKSDLNVWVDVDMSQDTPKILEIFKMPSFFMNQMPEADGKEYLVYDFDNMMEDAPNFKEFMNFTKDIQPKILEFLKNYPKNFNPGFEVASYRGKAFINGEDLSIYRVKLDDETFKELVKYVVNQGMDNEDTMKFMKEYMNAVMDFAQVSKAEKETIKEDLDQNMDKLEKNMPQIKDKFNKFMDTFKDVKVIGDKGIAIEFGVNKAGYIVHESGEIDLNIDLKAIGKALGQETFTEGLGTLKLGIKYNTKIYNINKDMKIDIPNVDKNNAIYYSDMIKQAQMERVEQLD